MADTLRRVFYYSDSLVAPDQVPAIIRASRANNRAQSITGALIYTGSRFGQLLEGPVASIETLLQKLRADPRHAGIRICFDKACKERLVPQWSMGYLTNIEFTQYVALLGDAPSDDGDRLVATFRKLMEAAETL